MRMWSDCDMRQKMTVTFETLLNGYIDAHLRFETARRTQSAEATFLPLFEALNWAVVMDDHIVHHWKPGGELLKYRWRDLLEVEERATIRGIRFARNRVHHQWADALQLNTGGFQFPIVFPMVTHEWSWVSADVIPLSKKDDQNRGIDEYRSELQGRLARRSLAVLEQVYRKMASEYLK